jgi:glycosyltransferase involved in cell wall biosynthesis
MDVSFIIPCLDEEKRIGRVVGQFKVLSGKYDYEVIVSDGGSKDSTASIARSEGATVIVGDRDTQNIAKNRNAGAKKACGDILIFCDADTQISNPLFFLKTVFSKFKDRRIVGGVPKIKVFRDEEKKEDKIFLTILNAYIRNSFRTKNPVASGQCQIVRKTAFEKIKGYDESMAHSEDMDMIERLGKTGRLFFFSNLIIYESARRYRKWGYPKLITTAASNLLSRYLFKKDLLKEWERVG